MQIIRNWFQRHFSDPQVVILAALLLTWSVIILLLGGMLAPVIASVVVAYLLEAVVSFMERYHVPRPVAVSLVLLAFIFFILFLLLGLFPLLSRQLFDLIQQLPAMITRGQQELMRLPERYPDFISEQQVTQITDLLQSELTKLGQQVLSFSVASVRSLMTIIVYLFLVPFLVFFLLKDKVLIMQWITSFLPEERTLASRVWQEVDSQIGNYVRGKIWEILIVWAASYVTFLLLGLEFAMLLGLFVGLSVLIPYIGAMFMGLPVALVAYFQWGWGPQFSYVVIAYTIIQLIDGNILATLLSSEVVNLHPVAVIVAVLVFGGLWGFWGLFFSVPLATLVHAVIKAWPRDRGEKKNMQEAGSSEIRDSSPEF